MNASPIRVLLVEDSPSDADVLQETLQQSGAGRFEICWEECLADALARLREQSFDVLLLDLSLPDSSGPDTFRCAQRAAPAMPMVVLTGEHDEKLGLTAVHEGIQDYLVKGESDAGQIARAIRYAIERKRSEERIRHYNAVLEARNRVFREALACSTKEQLCRACLKVAEELTSSKFGFIGEVTCQGRLDEITVSEPVGDGGRTCQPGDDKDVPGAQAFQEICGAVLRDGKALYTKDAAQCPDRIGHRGLTAFLGAPLIHAGQITGVIGLAGRDGGYRPQDLEALEALAIGIVEVLMRERAERAVRESEERLREAQKMESIGVLAGGIAHDFNNLLVGVIGNACLAEDMIPDGHPARDVLKLIIESGEQAAQLTRQMLAYAGKGRFVVEPVNLSSLVTSASPLIRGLVSMRIAVDVAVAPDVLTVESDPSQIQQIVMNLALNAGEAIGDAAGVISITTGNIDLDAGYIQRRLAAWPLRPGRFAYLEVRDTGCGMDETTESKIFDPFFTTKFQGRGLGLAAVAGIVRAHNGGIELTTKPGAGSTFRVLLPVMPITTLSPESEVEAQRDLKGKGAVLVVDDERVVRDVSQCGLERHGYQVLLADSGPAAIDVVRTQGDAIRLVVLDLAMPGMDGVEALEEIRKIRPDINVVVSSGFSESEALKLLNGARISGFIQKPYTIQQFARQVDAAVNGNAATQTAS